MMCYVKLIEDLQQLQMQCNSGRGLNCVQDIIEYLKNGDLHHAKVVACNEFDKIRYYSDICQYIEQNIL